MSSTTRLLVLGVVKMFQPVHGYVVHRELLSWRAQEWASVQPGSIYNALKSLTRDGLIEIASTDQVGGRPERTTYRLTRAGEEEFRSLLSEEWWTVRPPVDPLMAAISFLGEIPRVEAIAALEHRAAHIHGMLRHLGFAIEAHDGTDSPPHVREMMRLMSARVGAELAWSQQFLERLRNGEYATGGDPPWQPPPFSPPPARRRTTRDGGGPSPAPNRRTTRNGGGLSPAPRGRNRSPRREPSLRDAPAGAFERSEIGGGDPAGSAGVAGRKARRIDRSEIGRGNPAGSAGAAGRKARGIERSEIGGGIDRRRRNGARTADPRAMTEPRPAAPASESRDSSPSAPRAVRRRRSHRSRRYSAR